MPNVRLTMGEVKGASLPRVCMRCGASADVVKERKFSWRPSWVLVTLFAGLLPYLIISAILTKYMTVPAPLCQEHQGHWSKRTIFNLCYFLALAALVVGLIVVPNLLDLRGQALDNVVGFACLSIPGALFIWLVVNIIIETQMITPTEITERSITLKGVHAGFVDAVERWRDADYDDEDVAPRDPRGGGPDQSYRPKR